MNLSAIRDPFEAIVNDGVRRAPCGAFTGQRGFFTRDDNGAVTGVDLAGRLFNRIRTTSE